MSTPSDLPPKVPLEKESDSTLDPRVSPTLLTTSGLTPNAAAGLAMLFVLLGGVVLLVIEKKNQFVRFWAMQSVVFGLAWFALTILTVIINFILIGPLHFIASLWNVLFVYGVRIVYIIATVQAFRGKEWEIPFVGKIARQQLNRPSVPLE